MNIIETNKKIIERFMDALGSEDMKTLDEFMSDDLRWIIPQSPELSPIAGFHTKEKFFKLYEDHHGDFPEGKRFTITGITAEGNRVAVEAESKGESLYGPFHNRYHFLFELDGGKIVTVKEYADSLYMSEFARRRKKAVD